MKKLSLIFSTLALGAFLLSSCSAINPGHGGDCPGVKSSGKLNKKRRG